MNTMLELFRAAGYEDFRSMELFKGYKPKHNIEVETLDLATSKPIYKRVNALFYKGLSTDGYIVKIKGRNSFRVTPSHRFYSSLLGDYATAESLAPAFIAVDRSGNNVEVRLERSAEPFEVLDIEVADISAYLSESILSHNSFGATAKVFANGLKFINPILARHDCSMVVINQERDSMSLFGADFTTTGGRAIKYYASWRGRVTRIDDILDKGSLVGIVSKVRATKNKIGINKREAELKLKFASGFDSEEEYIKFVIDLGIVTQRGAWFYQEDWEYKGSGRASLVEFLRSKPELFESVKNTVNAQLCGETTIDRENALKATDEEYDPEEETPPED